MNQKTNHLTVYKKTATGAVQEWTIFHADGAFWTVSGQIDGKKVTSAKTYCAGKNVGRKNATTANEQAEREALSRWQKKKDEGYVSELAQLNESTDKIEPMLAKDYHDYKHELVFPVYSQPKLDGIRCIITRNGAYSRKWKPFATLGYVQKALEPIFEKYPSVLAFDGEMYSHDLKDNFEEIVSIVKQPKATSEDLIKCEQMIQYHIYDYVTNESVPFSRRNLDLGLMISEEVAPCLKLVKTSMCWNQEELDNEYQWYMIDGFEGQMVRSGIAAYQQKRTKMLLKRKEFVDAEFKIVGYKEGKGNRMGCVILVLTTEDGKEFDSVPMGNMEYMRKLWGKRLDLIGLYATVKYQNLSKEGIPRFNNTIKFRK